jgi:ABC-2 type transport system permease protein
MGWITHLFSLEIRKVLSYRVDFWINFVGAVLTEMLIAYFLWKAVYDANHASQIGGYSFKAMLLYYILVALSRRAVMSLDHGAISYEIYDGSLNRYLVYPVSVFGYKYVSWIANAWVTYLQLLMSLGLFVFAVGMPSDRQFGWQNLLFGSLSLWAASSVYYIFSMLFEMVAFWAESVWSLLVMLRFIALLMGGGLIPIALFPEWSKSVLHDLPFEHMISVPVRCLMGEVGGAEFLSSLGILGVWAILMSACLAWVWRKGTIQYSGVGI